MLSLQWIFRTFPAASRAALIAVTTTVLLLIGLRLFFNDPRPSLFLLGDSCIGNYRLDPGQRLQDILERMDPGTRVENWAEPGATPLDYYLQWQRGALVAGAPAKVVIAFEPDKFMNQTCPHRLDEDGVNLRWIPWNRSGVDLFRMLSPHEKSVALVQQASVPFYAAADVGRLLWIRYLQWPSERKHMRNAPPTRRVKIEAKAAELGKAWDTVTVPDEAEFAAMPRTLDAGFLMRSLRRAGTETRVVLLPYGNPDLLKKIWSPAVLAKQDSMVVLVRHWLESQGVEFIDLNAPDAIAHFPDPVWDDMAHLKDPAAFSYMAERVHTSLAKFSAPRSSLTAPGRLTRSPDED